MESASLELCSFSEEAGSEDSAELEGTTTGPDCVASEEDTRGGSEEAALETGSEDSAPSCSPSQIEGRLSREYQPSSVSLQTPGFSSAYRKNSLFEASGKDTIPIYVTGCVSANLVQS